VLGGAAIRRRDAAGPRARTTLAYSIGRAGGTQTSTEGIAEAVLVPSDRSAGGHISRFSVGAPRPGRGHSLY
jgi:hypothetical protein